MMEMSVQGEEIVHNHGLNVAKISQQMSIELNCSPVFIKTIYIAAFYHDIGKNYLPLNLLNKPDKLTFHERELIKTHAVMGFIEGTKSLREYPGNFSLYEQDMITSVILTHHERFDGKGYPIGLKGHEIPLASRITSYGDVCEALSAARTYKCISTMTDTLKIITEQSPGQFDPELKEAFLESIKKLNGDSLMANFS